MSLKLYKSAELYSEAPTRVAEVKADSSCSSDLPWRTLRAQGPYTAPVKDNVIVLGRDCGFQSPSSPRL